MGDYQQAEHDKKMDYQQAEHDKRMDYQRAEHDKRMASGLNIIREMVDLTWRLLTG